jgi:hypothetical protein
MNGDALHLQQSALGASNGEQRTVRRRHDLSPMAHNILDMALRNNG